MPDSPETLISWLRLVTGSSFVMGVLFLLLSLMFFRRSRRDAYWRQRRQAGEKGFRYTVLSVFLLTLSGAFCLITLTISYVEDEDTTAQQVTPTETPTTFINDTPTVVEESTLPPTQSEIMTAEPVEPEITATQPIPTSAPTEIALSSSAGIQAIDDVISDTWQPIQPDTTFSSTAQRLYFFFRYDNLSQGDTWGQVLLKDGEVLQKRSSIWGITQPQGETFFFFGNQDGFEPGNYEILITFSEDEIPLTSTRFIILPE